MGVDPDPRISLVLNSGTKSCLPKIFVFEPEQLEETLDVAAHDFLDSFVDYNMNRATVRLPKLLDWYAADFAPTGSKFGVVRALLPYLSERKSRAIERLLSQGKTKVKYNNFDWQFHDDYVLM